MLLSKLKNLQGRIKTLDQEQCFHLDQQENQAALEAKKQLQAISQQQIYNQIPDQPIRASQNKSIWDKGHTNSIKKSNATNIRDSSITKASEHDEKPLTCRPGNRTERRKYLARCSRHNKTENHQNINNYLQNHQHRESNSIWLQQNLQKIHNDKKSTLSHYFTKLEFYKKNDHSGSKPTCQTFRSYSLQSPESNSFKPHRILTSRKKRSSSFFHATDYFQNVNKPYSFNDTLFGMKSCRSSQKSPGRTHRKFSILFEEEPKVRPATSRQSLSKIELRPQFLKLVMKIKQKEELKFKQKIMPVKGRKSLK